MNLLACFRLLFPFVFLDKPGVNCCEERTWAYLLLEKETDGGVNLPCCLCVLASPFSFSYCRSFTLLFLYPRSAFLVFQSPAFPTVFSPLFFFLLSRSPLFFSLSRLLSHLPYSALFSVLLSVSLLFSSLHFTFSVFFLLCLVPSPVFLPPCFLLSFFPTVFFFCCLLPSSFSSSFSGFYKPKNGLRCNVQLGNGM